MPCALKRVSVAGSLIAETIAVLSFCTIAGGVLAGAIKLYQFVARYPGKPSSAMVGTSGKSAARLEPVTASARSFPALINGIAVGALAKIAWISPPNKPFIAGPPPL